MLGFVVGPGLQAAVTPLGEDGFILMGLPLNMFTAAGWINVLMGIVNFCLFLPFSFKEHKIAAREAMRDQGKASGIILIIYSYCLESLQAHACAPVPLYVFVFTGSTSFSLSTREGDLEIHETGLPGGLDLDMGLLCLGLQLCAAGNVNIERAFSLMLLLL